MTFRPEDYLADLIGAACLLVEDGLEIAYSHRSFQEYFVALQIASALPDIQNKLIDRYWPNMGSDNVMGLLLEINPNLVESALLVPKLEQLFADIGVKRKVGVTHTAKYFKKIYSEYVIDKDRIFATIANHKSDLSNVVHMAVRHCATYTFPPKTEFDERFKVMQKKYGKVGARIEHKTKELTLRSPLLLDILESIGAFSTEYLDAGYEAYKLLKLKHTNTVQDLDSLLGIR